MTQKALFLELREEAEQDVQGHGVLMTAAAYGVEVIVNETIDEFLDRLALTELNRSFA